ncbi:MAG: amidase [Chloroflexi bacterium]|nr:amidase [Chloroflexota bacterium]
MGIEELGKGYRAKSLSVSEVVEGALARIAELEPRVNAFIAVTAERARADARERDRELAGGTDRGPLHGVPIAVKDLFDVRGVVTTAGSSFLRDSVANADSEVWRRLREAGAVMLGKTNLHEWAFGVTNDNPHYGPARNPWDLARVPGGSSGGSAIAVATGSCPIALGTDTGGSIRIPASLCGVVGLKPTRGRVSLRGVIPLSWTLDHAGPLARSVRDAARVLSCIAGYDDEDPGSVDRPVDDYLIAIEDGVRGMRIAVPTDPFFTDVDPEVRRAVEESARLLEREGARLVPLSLPWVAEIGPFQAILIGSDAAAFHHDRLAESADGFGADVRERLQRGAARTGTDVALARRARTRMRREAARLFGEHDVLLLPATPIAAPELAGSDALAAAARLTTFTAPFNFTALPAIALPCGNTAGGLPIGLQLVSGPWREAELLRCARAFERATGGAKLARL